ncbi:unnamed protein product, partial [Phaeothamnion confervicola]
LRQPLPGGRRGNAACAWSMQLKVPWPGLRRKRHCCCGGALEELRVRGWTGAVSCCALACFGSKTAFGGGALVTWMRPVGCGLGSACRLRSGAHGILLMEVVGGGGLGKAVEEG